MMIRTLTVSLLISGAALLMCNARLQADDKTKSETFNDLTLQVPSHWMKEQPKARLRLGQFAIPATKGDDKASELSIFNFGAGGDVKSNIERWIGKFQPQGRTAKISTGEGDIGNYVFVDLSGTYKKPDGPPFLQKTKDVPGMRMCAVILVIENKGIYYLKLVGKQKTVAAEVNNFRKSFGADESKEKAYEKSVPKN